MWVLLSVIPFDAFEGSGGNWGRGIGGESDRGRGLRGRGGGGGRRDTRRLGVHGLGFLNPDPRVVIVRLLGRVAGGHGTVGVLFAKPLVVVAEGVDDGLGHLAPLIARVAPDPPHRHRRITRGRLLHLHRLGFRLVVVRVLGLGRDAAELRHGSVGVHLTDPLVVVAEGFGDGEGDLAPFPARIAPDPLQRLVRCDGLGRGGLARLLLAAVLPAVRAHGCLMISKLRQPS